MIVRRSLLVRFGQSAIRHASATMVAAVAFRDLAHGSEEVVSARERRRRHADTVIADRATRHYSRASPSRY